MPNFKDVDPGPEDGPKQKWVEVDPETHVGPTPPPPTKGLGMQTWDFVKTLGTDLGGSVADLTLPAVLHDPRAPMERGKAIFDQAKDQWGKAKQQAGQGNYLGATLYGAGAALPVVGPMLNNTAEEWAGGDYGKAAAHTAEIFGPEILHETGVPKLFGDLFTKDAQVAAAKAWGPSPRNDRFLDNVHDAGRDIIRYGNDGKLPRSNQEAIIAADKANKALDAEMDNWMKAGKRNGAVILGNEIVRATWEALPDTLKLEQPKLASRIMKQVRSAYGNKQIPIELADKFKRQKTAALDAFYDKSTGQKISTDAAGNTEAVVKAQRDAIADALYRALDPTTGGAGPREIGLRQSKIIDILDQARLRKGQAAASKPVSKFAAISGAIPQAWRGTFSHGGLGFVRGADIMNPETLFKGSVDPWVKKFFNSVQGTAPDIPAPYRSAAPARLLPPATKRLGPWTTPSGPAMPPYMGRGMSPGIGNRALPAASQTQVPGFAAGPGTGAGTVLPPAGDAATMVPVQNPATGLIEYVPEWYRQRQGWATTEEVSGKPGELLDVQRALNKPTQANDARPFGRKVTDRQGRTITRAARAKPTTPPNIPSVESTGRTADPIRTRVAKSGSGVNAERWTPPKAPSGAKPVPAARVEGPTSAPVGLERSWAEIMQNFDVLLGGG